MIIPDEHKPIHKEERYEIYDENDVYCGSLYRIIDIDKENQRKTEAELNNDH